MSHFGTDADFLDVNQELQESMKTLGNELSASLLKTNQLTQQLQREKNRKDFSLLCFKNHDNKIRFYTGFVSFGMFLACFNFQLSK